MRIGLNLSIALTCAGGNHVKYLADVSDPIRWGCDVMSGLHKFSSV
jgi:uncharacterized NAD-dependent epimerase/dehydratase family protein